MKVDNMLRNVFKPRPLTKGPITLMVIGAYLMVAGYVGFKPIQRMFPADWSLHHDNPESGSKKLGGLGVLVFVIGLRWWIKPVHF
jgi:hypothetical protein